MKRRPLSFGAAIGLFIIGVLLGTVATFGMQFWNKPIEREACKSFETQFVAYDEGRPKYLPSKKKEIRIDCSNGGRYFIDIVSINTELLNALSELKVHENISLLIHPNSNTIVELANETAILLRFDETIEKLEQEATGFLFFGIFMYFCALVGLYQIILQTIRKRRAKKVKR